MISSSLKSLDCNSVNCTLYPSSQRYPILLDHQRRSSFQCLLPNLPRRQMSQLRVDSRLCLSEPIPFDKIDASKRGCGSLAVKVSSWEFMPHVNADATPTKQERETKQIDLSYNFLEQTLEEGIAKRWGRSGCWILGNALKIKL
ncbi:hypothetical protein AVEN_66567-1 [Araneus ventricosus]|uniref:Uncharacterized protein n=1 Tax=Araneus ventricosus TaxID=182803 RepID=A0A4Y2EFZ6_ARAVE|nr:hypothetical protein AVEN_66567-1 [Araneus ventricosus]